MLIIASYLYFVGEIIIWMRWKGEKSINNLRHLIGVNHMLDRELHKLRQVLSQGIGM